MTAFVLVASLLTLTIIAALVYPLVRPRDASPVYWPVVAVTAVIMAGGAGALYPLWSKWNWSTPAVATDSPAAMVGRLARRLESNPDDLQGWLMLGRSYGVIEQYGSAVNAYQRADRLAQGRNAEALMGLAEALVLSERSELTGRAGQLFEQALALDPGSTKALFYSAIAALERGEKPVARERFVRLLNGNPPPEVRALIEQQIAALGAAPSEAPAASPALVKVPLHILLSKEVASKAMSGAPLFVLARTPGQRGPPLAARRLEAKFPQEVELLSTDAMISGSGFLAGQEIEVEARIANGGSAISRSGDPFGVVLLKAGIGARATIEINQIKP